MTESTFNTLTSILFGGYIWYCLVIGFTLAFILGKFVRGGKP